MSKLIQLKVDPILQKDLHFLAEYKGIPLTSFVKLTLKEAIRKEKIHIFTENGLTEDQEVEILEREREAMNAYHKGQLQPKTASEILKELNA